MRVTPWNVGKFWIRLMFPPTHKEYHSMRLMLRGDLPWEPWLHCGVWLSTFWVLVFGEALVIPPIDHQDIIWITFGLLSPPIGFASVWMLAFYTGRVKYVALYMRMVADLGLCIGLAGYQYARFAAHQNIVWPNGSLGAVGDTLVLLSIAYMLTMVWKDIKFIIATEKLAALIYKDVRELSVSKWVSRWGDDAGR